MGALDDDSTLFSTCLDNFASTFLDVFVSRFFVALFSAFLGALFSTFSLPTGDSLLMRFRFSDDFFFVFDSAS